MKNMYSFISGFLVATLGGLIGLGGAEFRLPILVGFFSFATLNAVIINKVGQNSTQGLKATKKFKSSLI